MKLQILLIEDNPSDVRLFQEYLRGVNLFSYELVHMDRLSNALEYLAVSQRIVERHDGNIWVESEPGKGSKFIFTLPKHNQSEGSTEKEFSHDTV